MDKTSVNIKCGCGAEGWLVIEDEAYTTNCPHCGKYYTVHPDGTVEEV